MGSYRPEKRGLPPRLQGREGGQVRLGSRIQVRETPTVEYR
jgi:hypothetical protein